MERQPKIDRDALQEQGLQFFWPRAVKRCLDVSLACVSLLLLSPLIAGIAILIRLSSPGPALFRQTRLGKDGLPFTILKFRTMVDGAQNIGSGVYTFVGDPRVTRIGRLLRKTSLDELPQLINVVRGDMSIVGPRPPLTDHPKELSSYSTAELVRFKVRPGITGYAQVLGRNSLSWSERFVLDREYVYNWSLGLDFSILCKTIGQVLAGRGVTVRRKEGQ